MFKKLALALSAVLVLARCGPSKEAKANLAAADAFMAENGAALGTRSTLPIEYLLKTD